MKPLVGNKKRARSLDLSFDDANKKRNLGDLLTTNSQLTTHFFNDMAATIVRRFPVKEFAKAHECQAIDVFDAVLL